MSTVQSLRVEVPFTCMWLIILNPVHSLYSDSHICITIKETVYSPVLFSPGLFCFLGLRERFSQSKREQIMYVSVLKGSARDSPASSGSPEAAACVGFNGGSQLMLIRDADGCSCVRR